MLSSGLLDAWLWALSKRSSLEKDDSGKTFPSTGLSLYLIRDSLALMFYKPSKLWNCGIRGHDQEEMWFWKLTGMCGQMM